MKEMKISSLLNTIGELFSDEVSIAVTNTEKYIYYRPSKRLNLKIKEGDPIKEGTMAHKALVSRQKVSEYINRNIFGVPYYGMAVPIFHEQTLEGVIVAIYPALTDAKWVVTVKTADGWIPIPYNDIVYLEAKDKKTKVYSKEITGFHKNCLHEFEYILPKNSFIRCHRSFIVNVNRIKAIYPDTHSTFILVMDNHERVPVSQSYSSYFRRLLGF